MTAPRRTLAAPIGAILFTSLAAAALGNTSRPAVAQIAAAADYVLTDAVDGAAPAVAAIDGSTVAAGIGARVGVLDVSERSAPRLVGRTALLPSVPLDLAADASAHVVVAALAGSGLAVIDVSEPERPRLAARLCLPRPPSAGAAPSRAVRPPASSAACRAGEGPSVVAVAAVGDGATALAVADGGLLVADVADPYWPRQLAWLPLGIEARAIAVVPGAAIVLGAVAEGADAGNRLVVVDIHAPHEPFVRAWVKLGGPVGAFGDVAAAGMIAVAGGPAGAAVVDVTEPDRPRVAARIDRFVAAVDVRGDGQRTVAGLAVNATAQQTGSPILQDIAVFDVTAPRSPRLVGSRATVTNIGLNALALGPLGGASPWCTAVSSLAGVTVLDLPAADGPIVASGEVLTAGATLVGSDGAGHALLIEGDPSGVNSLARLAVVDLDSGASIGVLAGLDSVIALAAAGDRAYIIENGHGVRIVGLSDPTAPRTIGYITALTVPLHVAAAEGRIAVGDFFGTVQLLDVADPTHVRVLSAIAGPPTDQGVTPFDIGLVGERLIIARNDRLAAFDVHDPQRPKAVGEALYDANEPLGVTPHLAVSGTRAWVASLSGGLIAFDARAPLPRRLARFADIAAERVIEVGGRAVVVLAGERPAGDASARTPSGVLAVVEAPIGGGDGGIIGRWDAPGLAADLAVDPRPGSLGMLIASGAYGMTRWRLRAEGAPTATPTPAEPQPTAARPARTAVPPDARWPHRAFLPLVTRGANGPRAAEPLSLVAAMGGAVTSVTAEGDFGYVAEADRLVALRIRGQRRDPSARGPEPLGYAAVGERTVALAVSRRRLAALVGPPKALRPVIPLASRLAGAVPAGGGGDGGGDGGGGRPAPIDRSEGDGVAIRLFNIDDPIRPLPKARVTLPGGAFDIAAGGDDLIGWFAIVGTGADGGYLFMLNANDAVAPQTTRLDLGPDVVPIGIAVSGRRALVLLDRGDGSAVLQISLERPEHPAPLGTLVGLGQATGVGAIAAAEDNGFVLTTDGLIAVTMSGREPVIVARQSANFFGTEPVFVTAIGSNVWVSTISGEIIQLVLFDGGLEMINFISAPSLSAPGLRRFMAATPGAIIVGGGLMGGATVAGVSMVIVPDRASPSDPYPEPRGPASADDRPRADQRVGGGAGDVLGGRWGALGACAAVASGGQLPGHAIAVNGDGSLVALEARRSDGQAALRTMGTTGDFLPLPPTGAAIDANLAVIAGPLTPLRSFRIAQGLARPVAEPPDNRTGGALDVLRDAPMTRRVVLADGFAWVAERGAGIAVYDAAEPQPLTFVGRIETPGQPRDLVERGGRVFVADGTAGLTILDARNPASLRESGHLSPPGEVGAVALSADGATVFIAVEGADGAWLGSGRDRGAIWAVDARDPARPRVIGSVGIDLSRVASLLVDGGRLYAAGLRGPAGAPLAPGGGTMVVAAFDVTDPARPSEVGRWTAPGDYPYAPSALTKVGTRLVVAQGDGGALVIDAGR
ncbi:MAG: hypothetical protein ABI780_06240 [Ardenticatenales bacterium]